MRDVELVEKRVEVMLGLRDPRTEQMLVASGVSDGDTLLRGAAQGIAAGTALYGGLVLGLVRLGLMLWSEDPEAVSDGDPAVAA